eukprot:783287-Rhodomonas_salina.4
MLIKTKELAPPDFVFVLDRVGKRTMQSEYKTVRAYHHWVLNGTDAATAPSAVASPGTSSCRPDLMLGNSPTECESAMRLRTRGMDYTYLVRFQVLTGGYGATRSMYELNDEVVYAPTRTR